MILHQCFAEFLDPLAEFKVLFECHLHFYPRVFVGLIFLPIRQTLIAVFRDAHVGERPGQGQRRIPQQLHPAHQIPTFAIAGVLDGIAAAAPRFRP